jgi:malate synthase
VANSINKAGLEVADVLVRFIEDQALVGTGIEPNVFWTGMADIYARFEGENRALLATRDKMQAQIDAWHEARSGKPIDTQEYEAFLRSIGYLVDEPEPFTITSNGVDDEVARIAGPQLVVPVTNARFLLNAANARWGSLYDALYGTDAIPGHPSGSGYDANRGAQVIAWVREFLDNIVPLEGDLPWHEITGLQIIDGKLVLRVDGHHDRVTGLSVADGFKAYRGEPSAPSTVLLKHNGLHLELVIDRNHPIGKDDRFGLADVIVESALTTIVDLEDSIVAVDADDKVAAYANWLGLMRGDLEASFPKNGQMVSRALQADRHYIATDGSDLVLSGRSVLFVRNVGHLMRTPAIYLSSGSQAPEGILDGIVTALIAIHDLKGNGRFRNSRTGSIYIVKPKMHGPEEVRFTDRLFDAIEDLFGFHRHAIKLGVMDEERRTSANLAACIAAVKGRIVFINTGFLDRTGDEIHTSMRAGPMVRKGDMKTADWIAAYEDRNMQIGLACGLSGRAQIGKGMWAAPDRMGDMLEQKIDHPRSGANTAWVPSPTAATLHATHYHRVDVFERQAIRKKEPLTPLRKLLTIPVALSRPWSSKEINSELENNAQGLLGYVVRWIDQGIGCSKVPDILDIGLMEDRATLRISSQHLANWLFHGVVTPAQVDDALYRMAVKVDAQNASDRLYQSIAVNRDTNLAFQAARALVFEGAAQPNGYTEPLLHRFRLQAKTGRSSDAAL